MTALEWAGFAAGITTTLIGVLAGLRWLVKGWLNELRPNGGSSMKDQLTSLQKETTPLSTRIDELFNVIRKNENKAMANTRKNKNTQSPFSLRVQQLHAWSRTPG